MNHIIKKLPTILILKIKKYIPILQLIPECKDGCDKTIISKQNDLNAQVSKLKSQLDLKFLFKKNDIKNDDSFFNQSPFVEVKAKLFVKRLRTISFQELYQSSVAARNESIVYKRIIPHLNVYKDTSLPLPFCHFADYNKIVLENLCESNYKPFDVKKGFITINECIPILKALAKFHGATMVLKRKYGADSRRIRMLTKGILYNYTDSVILKLQQNRLQNILSIYNSRKPSEENENKIEALKYLIKVAKSNFENLESNKKNKYVFCHGNLLLTNILYKPIERENKVKEEEEKKMEREIDIKFVDFQKVVYSSLAKDLVFLLFVNLNPDDYITRKHHLLFNYLMSLIKYTEKGGLEDLSLNFNWLRDEVDRYTEYGIINALWYLPMFDGDNNEDTGDVTSEILNESSKKVFLNERMEKWIDYYSAIFKEESQNNY